MDRHRTGRAWFLIGLTVLVSVVLLLAGPIRESGVYHDFSDKRFLPGVPNSLNVISNIPFLLIGLWGLRLVIGSSTGWPVRLIYAVLFLGIFLTGIGSAWYHLAPDNERLVYDRLPMTIVFTSLLSATIAEYIDPGWGTALLGPLVLTGAGSVILWHYTDRQGAGDLRLYVLVQYYPILLIPLILWLYPEHRLAKAGRYLQWAVIWYVIAKALDLSDRPLFDFTGFVSGHTLKHLAAAAATLCLVKIFQSKHLSYGKV